MLTLVAITALIGIVPLALGLAFYVFMDARNRRTK